jgi:hypothetical protein
VLAGTLLASLGVLAPLLRADVDADNAPWLRLVPGPPVKLQATAAAPPPARGPYALTVLRCEQRIITEWRDRDGRTAAWDEAFEEGGRLVRYELRRPTVAQHFIGTRSAPDQFVVGAAPHGRARALRLRTDVPLLAGAMLVTWAQAQLPTLRAGATVRADYLLADRPAVLPLQLRAERAVPDGWVRVRAEPTSPLLKPFVPPVELDFDAADHFRALSGRLLPMALEAGAAVAVDGHVTRDSTPSALTAALPSDCNNQ